MSNLKFSAPLRTDLELRELARRQGRTLSDVILHAVQRGLGSASIELPDDTALVDRVERGAGSRGKATAVYLSQPIASALRRLAEQEQRSQSWLVRSLLRDALRQRGLLLADVETTTAS